MINQRLGTNLVSFRQEEPCCAALQVADSNFRALQVTTNSSTQHGRNTDFLASFASGWDTDTIGLVRSVGLGTGDYIAAKLVQETLSCL
jgi:hypothetical protein